MSIKNVIIVGAGGNLGPSVLNAFITSSKFNISVLSRQESTSTFPSNINVLKADYSSIESLTTALKGQDAVVSIIGIPDSQKNLIDASIAAGVKRFIPSEFGSNTANPKAVELVPFLSGKVQIINYLKTKEDAISWSGVVTGAFFDWGIKVGFLGFDVNNKTAMLVDGGKATFTGTNLQKIGLALVKVLENADLTKNKFIYVSSFTTTQNEILAAIEKITGDKWTVKNESSQNLFKSGGERLSKGDFSGIEPLLRGLLLGEANLGDLTPVGLWDEKLGLEKESFEESIKAAVGGRLYGQK